MPSFFQNPIDRKWVVLLVVIFLLFVFLVYCVWLYYSYNLKKLDHQKLLMLPNVYQLPCISGNWILKKSTQVM